MLCWLLRFARLSTGPYITVFRLNMDATKMIAKHNSSGFAFAAHNRPPIDGEVTYGDTSISLDYKKFMADWTVLWNGIESSGPISAYRVFYARYDNVSLVASRSESTFYLAQGNCPRPIHSKR